MTCWFQCWKHSLSLSQSVCAIDVKKDGSVLGENQLLRFYDCFPLLIGLGHLHCHYCRNCPWENWTLDSFDKVSFFLGWVYLYKCVKSFLSVDLAILRPTLSYWHVGGLNQLTSLIGQFLTWNQGHQELHNDVRPKTQQKASVGFEPEPSNSNSNEKLKDFWPMSNWKCISIL